jgi:hypothetical protein
MPDFRYLLPAVGMRERPRHVRAARKGQQVSHERLLPMSEQQPARRRSGGRLLAHLAAVIDVLAATAAVFA